MIIPTTIRDQLLYHTTRIRARTPDGREPLGTGFFFAHYIPGTNKVMNFVVTNKHVVEGAFVASFLLHLGERKNGAFVPAGRSIDIELFNLGERVFGHPDPNVDLCLIPFSDAITWIKEQHDATPYFLPVDKERVATPAVLTELTAVEDILMIGYPNGLWDEVNNYPIIRRGLTATHPAVNFKGKPEGVIDIAALPGSSGSPVLIVNEGGYMQGGDFIVGSSRVWFLGVLYAGPQMTAEGSIVIKDVPTVQLPFAQINLMMHLGYYIKASQVDALVDAYVAREKQRGTYPTS